MKELHITKYQCEKCGAKYNDQDSAYLCEQKAVLYDKGVKVGDVVLITKGDGAGHKCKVTSVGVHEPGWGPHFYDHTVFVSGDVIDSWGSRQLSFDSYEVIHSN